MFIHLTDKQLVKIAGFIIKEHIGENIQDGIDYVFNVNPHLALIGNKKEYNSYLDSIFPDTKVKDIVYHRTKSKTPFENFDLSFAKNYGDYGKGFYFAPMDKIKNIWNNSALNKSTNIIIPVKLNIIKPFIDPSDRSNTEFENFINKNPDEGVRSYAKLYHDSVIDFYDETRSDFKGGTPLQYFVFQPNQTHILGSEKDMNGFKKYMRL